MSRVVEEIELGARGVGQNEDISDSLEDMKYAEKFILNADTLKLLAGLKIAEKYKDGDTEKIKGGVLLIERVDLDSLGYDGEFFSGAANKLNQVFVHMQVPYLASGYTSKDAPTVEKTRTKGENKGTTYSIKPADLIRVIRTGKEFDIDLYAAEGSKKVAPVEKDGKTVTPSTYNEPTPGMRARIDRWIAENGSEVAEFLNKMGMDIEIKE